MNKKGKKEQNTSVSQDKEEKKSETKKGKLNSIKKTAKVGKSQMTAGKLKMKTTKGKYQIVIDPIIKKSNLGSKDALISCLKKKKMTFYQKWSFNKYKKGSKLSDNDQERLLSMASWCAKADPMIPPPKNSTKKGYKNNGKTKKGASKGKVGK